MMKKRLIAVITVFCLLLSLFSGMLLPIGAESEVPYARDLESNPDARTFYVANQADLEALAEAVNGGNRMEGYTFLQTADITLEGEWTPIGNNPANVTYNKGANPFMGTYDGQKHTISNLNIEETEYDSSTGGAGNGIGLFGCCYLATLKNIGIESGSVVGGDRVGALAGYADSCTVINCYNKASVRSTHGEHGVGGLLGVARPINGSAKLYGCFNLGAVSSDACAASGLAGWTCKGDNFEVYNCYSGGTVTIASTTAYGEPRCDVIARNSNRVTGDFSSCYYLSGICSDTYNNNNATKLESPNNAKMAYIMNHAMGSNNNAFSVNESGELAFYQGDGVAVCQVKVSSTRGGVQLSDAYESYLFEGETYTLPDEFSGFALDRAYANGKWYFAGQQIPLQGTSMEVKLTLKGAYPSVTELLTQPDSAIYTVSTAAELAQMAQLVNAGNSYAGKTVYVIADLDFSAHTTWTPIGMVTSSGGGNPDANAKPFSGIFDGQSHRFKNINFTQTGEYQALFRYVENATIRNLILDEGTVTTNNIRGAALVSLLRNSRLYNIENHLSVLATKTTGTNYNMGVVALSPGSVIESVISYGTMGNAWNIKQENGGISGYGYSSCTVKNCIVAGAVNGTGSEVIARGCTLENCYYVGETYICNSMDQETLLSREAAWILNNGGEAMWALASYGPTLDPENAIHRVTFKCTGENVPADFYAYYSVGEEVTIPEVAGYTLESAACMEQPVEGSFAMPARDLIVTLALQGNTYNIHYELNGGAFTREPQRSYTSGVSLELPGHDMVTREGYSFVGWYLNAAGTGEKQNAIAGTEARPLIFYAIWVVPTEISGAEELIALAKGDLSGNYILTADIDLTDKDFTPIGTNEAPFTGVFDGNGYTISGLTLETSENYQGLFGVNEGVIRNVTLADDCTVTGNGYVGGIAGKNNGVIFDCISRATVETDPISASTYKIFDQNLCQWGDDQFVRAGDTTTSRRPGLLQRIEAYDPDIMCFQEVSFTAHDVYQGTVKKGTVQAWYTYLNANITDEYTIYGKNRGDGEGVAVAYKTDKFTEMDKGYFWISTDPDATTNSVSWDAACRRVCVWVALKDKTTGEQLVIYSIHLDHVGKIARREGAKLVASRMAALKETYPDAQFFVAGDYNEGPGNDGYNALTAEVDDVRYIAEETTTDGTCGNINQVGATPSGTIDYIMAYGEETEVTAFQVLREGYPATEDSTTLLNPSDHHGLLATFTALSDIRVGWITGANNGSVYRVFAEGNVNGEKETGLAIGVNNGKAQEIYSADTTQAIGKGTASGAVAPGEDALQTAYAVNQAAGYGAFTVSDGQYVVAGARQVSMPVCLTINGTATYALAGSTYTLDTTGYENPVCALDYVSLSGTAFTVPESDAVVTIAENKTCTESTFTYQVYNATYHYKVCSSNHITRERHRFGDAFEVPGVCEQKGCTRMVCLDCGYQYDYNYTDAPGHTWGAWVEEYPATETEQGRLCRACADCSAVDTRVIPCSTDCAIISYADTSEPGYLTVTLELQNNVGLSGLIVQASFDSSVLEVLEEESKPGDALNSMLSWDVFQKDFVRMPFAQSDNVYTNGTFYTLKFKVIGSGETTVEVDAYDATRTEEEKLVMATVYDRDVTVYVHPEHEFVYDQYQEEYRCGCGDVKPYGTYETIGDVPVMLQYMIGKSDLSIDLIAADFNGDGKVTMTDAALLMKKLNGR